MLYHAFNKQFAKTLHFLYRIFHVAFVQAYFIVYNLLDYNNSAKLASIDMYAPMPQGSFRKQNKLLCVRFPEVPFASFLNEISTKSPKSGFSGTFPTFSAGILFLENWAPSHFGHYHYASLCQKSAKTNELISRKAGNRWTDGRTNERTDKG